MLKVTFVLNVHPPALCSTTDLRILDKHEEVIKLAFPNVTVVREPYVSIEGAKVLFLHLAKQSHIGETMLDELPLLADMSAQARHAVVLSGMDPALARIQDAHGLGGAIVFQKTGVRMAYRSDIVDDRDKGEEFMQVFGDVTSAARWFRIYFPLLAERVYGGASVK